MDLADERWPVERGEQFRESPRTASAPADVGGRSSPERPRLEDLDTPITSTKIDGVPLEDDLLQQALETRDRVLELQHEAERARLDHHYAVRRLHAAGASMREIAEALALSHQRVHQIIDSGGAVEERGRSRRPRLLKRLRQTERCAPPDGPFERFLADARDAIVLAQEEARALNHNYVGTEHILLGLLGAEGGLAARLLAAIGVEANAVRSALEERLVGRGATEPPPGPLSFTPRSKKGLELAVREAKEDRSVHVRSEHLLLGIARLREGLAARVLRELGADYDDLQSRLRRAALACSFCGRSGVDVAHLVAGPGVFICDRCIDKGLQVATHGKDVVASRPQFRTVPPSRRSARCSFCRKGVADVGRLVVSGAVAICDDCLRLARETHQEGRRPRNDAND